MIAATIFQRLNGIAPDRIEIEEMKGGTANLGILLHKAHFPRDASPRVRRIVEKRTGLKKDRATARLLFKRQKQTRDTGGLPRIYRLVRSDDFLATFMEYVRNVDDPALREPQHAPAIAAALYRINGIILPDHAPPDPAALFEGRLQRLQDWLAASDLGTAAFEGLDELIETARRRMTDVPVWICHLDTGLPNMALNRRTGMVRLIDFGLLAHDFAGADLSSLYRVKLLKGFDFESLIESYCALSGLPLRDVRISTMFAAAQRSAYGFRQAKRLQDRKRTVRETEMLLKLVAEFQERILS